MNHEIKQRIDMINRGEVPQGYKKAKVGIVPKEWKPQKLRDFIDEYPELSNDINNIPLYSSSRKGLLPQSEYYNNKEAVETNLGYKVVPKGYVTYRHMSDDDVFHFNINNLGNKILVSSEYPVFTTKKLNTYFLIEYLNSMKRFLYFCKAQKKGGTRTRLYLNVLRQYEMPIPPLPEQKIIAEILTTCDRVIELKEKLIAEKQAQKKWLMQNLLTGKKRLKGFTGEWKKVQLSNICEIVTDSMNPQDNPNVEYKVYSLPSFDNGSMPKTLFGKQMDSNKFIIYSNMILFNKLNVRQKRVWHIKTIQDNCICSTEFLPLRFYSANIVFMKYVLLCDNTTLYFINKSSGTSNSQKRISPHDLLNFRIKSPDAKEQAAIANILSTADREIELLQSDLNEWRNKKKALMQLLLTGKVRVKV